MRKTGKKMKNISTTHLSIPIMGKKGTRTSRTEKAQTNDKETRENRKQRNGYITTIIKPDIKLRQLLVHPKDQLNKTSKCNVIYEKPMSKNIHRRNWTDLHHKGKMSIRNVVKKKCRID
ncbi:hypothetical protein AMECASPLE_024092 [Ameca splendens]|uniref:Uncharacterized protein n=1 Tax=Ameca splendens TaxID=208324 RepID=A0ABV0ZZU5_9TELE